jgi:hypothetical protein
MDGEIPMKPVSQFRIAKDVREREPWVVSRYENGRFVGGVCYSTFPEAINAACEWARNLARRSKAR